MALHFEANFFGHVLRLLRLNDFRTLTFTSVFEESPHTPMVFIGCYWGHIFQWLGVTLGQLPIPGLPFSSFVLSHSPFSLLSSFSFFPFYRVLPCIPTFNVLCSPIWHLTHSNPPTSEMGSWAYTVTLSMQDFLIRLWSCLFSELRVQGCVALWLPWWHCQVCFWFGTLFCV